MKPVNPNNSEHVRLELTARRIESESLSNVKCCRTRINWHQPEPDFPENLLGTCSQCGAWYVVGRLRGEPQEVLVRLSVNDLVLRGSVSV